MWLILMAGVPAFVSKYEIDKRRIDLQSASHDQRDPNISTYPSAPPTIEPVENLNIGREDAEKLNSETPFAVGPNPAAQPFRFTGSVEDFARATDCLAAGQLYEAGDDAKGQRAVAQVILNRVRHPAFPKSICAVVFQGQERATGCQFTFTCDGALARTYSDAAWKRAQAIAKLALSGDVYKPVGYATHYHTNWVVPYWSSSLDKIAAVDTHLFFRWKGWWGTPPAFRSFKTTTEPLISKIARFSSAHSSGALNTFDTPSPVIDDIASLAAKPALPLTTASLGQSFSGAKLIAMAPDAKTFLVELGGNASADQWPNIAHNLCAGRPSCRVMAWKAGKTPTGFPLNEPQIDTMAFSYIHSQDSGLQRSLWNCAQSPRTNAGECMRQRIPMMVGRAASNDVDHEPAGLAGVRKIDRYETVKIIPMTPRTVTQAQPSE